MIPKYEEYNNNLNIVKKITKHSPPHLHNALEIVYITEGSLEYGVADELYHMDKGDIAFAFPEVIHHCQKLDSGRGHAIFVQALPAITGQFQEQLQLLCPKNPILKADKVHSDIPNPLLAYVCRIVRNLSIKKYRSNTAQKRNSIYDVAISELEGCLATTKTVEEEVDARELKELLYAFLDSMSKENCVIFVRRYWFTDSYEQIATRVGMSEKNVSVRLVRIRKQLREYLEERGVTV